VDRHIDGLTLLQDLSERRVTFAEFLDRFRELPKSEQDRLLAAKPKPPAEK